MGRPFNDLTGRRFGRLVVQEIHPERSAAGKVRWICQCDCGGTSVVQSDHLAGGKTETCGCSQTRHGMRHTPEYVVWANMLQRCTNESIPTYQHYGARGIGVDSRWAVSFEAFYADMGPRPSPQHSIERRDVNGNYGPSNCYWATAVVQANNRRGNVVYEFQGQEFTQAQLCKAYGISPQTLKYRLDQGLELAEALTRQSGSGRPLCDPKEI